MSRVTIGSNHSFLPVCCQYIQYIYNLVLKKYINTVMNIYTSS